MAKPFSGEAKETRFRLPQHTMDQIKALMSEMSEDARTVVINAVAERHQRECSLEPERDVFAELDELKAAIAALKSL